MTTVFIYTPNSGSISNLDPGSCANHSACTGGGSLTDLAIGGSTSLYFMPSYTIQSVYFTVGDYCCYQSPRSVKAYLYLQPNNYQLLGWVLYGHLTNVPAGLNGSAYNHPASIYIGKPSTCCHDYEHDDPCWSGTHVHCEIGGGPYASSWGRMYFQCADPFAWGKSLFYWNST